VCVAAQGTWLRKPEVSSTSAFVHRHVVVLDERHTGWGQGHALPALAGDGQNGLVSGMTKGGRDSLIGAVEVDVKLLLELASKAGIGLGDVVAMTTSARAWDKDVPPMQRQAGVRKGAWWDAIWEAEMEAVAWGAKARGKGSVKRCRVV
jgi:hypothetical protein